MHGIEVTPFLAVECVKHMSQFSHSLLHCTGLLSQSPVPARCPSRAWQACMTDCLRVLALAAQRFRTAI
jgi:hypothetical protein